MVEALFQQPTALQQYHAAALSSLLPALASWVSAPDREVGVMATKLLCDLLLVLLWDPACCCYGEDSGRVEDGHTFGAHLHTRAFAAHTCQCTRALSKNAPICTLYDQKRTKKTVQLVLYDEKFTVLKNYCTMCNACVRRGSQ